MPLGVPFSVNTDLALYFDTDAELVAFTDGVSLGTVAQAADTGVSYIWNGTTWKSLNAATLYTGNGAPASSLGVNGDVYIDLDSGNFYDNISGTWTVVGDITPTIPADTWLYGTTTAATATGDNSNFYSEYTNNRVYQKGNVTSTIAATNRIAESTSANPIAFQTVAAVSAISGRMYLAYAWLVGPGGGAGSITSITGGPHWSLVKTASVASAGGSCRCSVYSAMSTSSIAGATLGIASTFGDVLRIHVVELTGTDTTGTDGSGAVVQSQSNTTTGATSVSASMNPFGDSTNNAVVAGYAHNATEATTQDTAFTELADGTTTLDGGWGFETAFLLGQDQTPGAGWTTSAQAVTIAVEIKANVSSSVWTRLIPGAKVYHSNFSVSATSAATTLFTQSIPGGLLETTSTVLIFVDGQYFNNSAGARGLALTLAFGGANVWGDTTGATAIPQNANTRGFSMFMVMANESSATVRKMSGYVRIGGTANGSVAGTGTITATDFSGATISGTSTVDTSSAQTLALTATLNTIVASVSLIGAVTVVVIP